MRLSTFLLLPMLSLFLSACSSSGPQVNPAVLSAATSRDVPTSTTSKMAAAQNLGFSDIRNLVSKGVPDSSVIAYLNSTQQVCRFSADQLADLKSAGADSQLLAFLGETQGFYGSRSAAQPGEAAKRPSGQYLNTPQYQDEQPFAYNQPAVDGFYDSAYEESLYSPFSFN